MKDFTNFNIKKEAKKTNSVILYGVIAIIISIVFFAWGSVKDEQAEKEMQDMHTIILSDSEKTEKMSYIDVKSEAYQFAIYDDEVESFYFVSDGEYLYVVFMNDSRQYEFKKESIKEKPIRVKGITKTPPLDVKKLAIEWYNESLEEDDEKLTVADYDYYFGEIYLDITDSIPSVAGLQFVVGFFAIIIGFVILIGGFVSKAKFSKSFKKMDYETKMELDKEMNDKDAFYYSGAHLYLTKNYIVNLRGKVGALKYSDIIWMYPYEYRVNGIRAQKHLKVMTSEGKTVAIANLDFVTKKGQDVFNEIWETIIKRNPDIVTGYTSENIKAMKEKQKEIKRNKKGV